MFLHILLVSCQLTLELFWKHGTGAIFQKYIISRVPYTKVLSQSTSGFRFLHHLTDLNEPDKHVTSVFLTSQHRKSYKPFKNGAICASAYLLCAQRFYRSPVFDRTFVQTLIAPCIADRSGTKVLCANFIANPILQCVQRFYLAQQHLSVL